MSRFSMIDFAPDAGEGAGEGGGTGEGTAEGEGAQAAAATEGAASTFTQTDVDRIVQERLGRQKAQFKDYDDLKAKAAEFDKIAESQKSELQKAQERAEAAEAKAAEVEARAKNLLTDAAITAAATGKLADPTDALAMLDRGSIEYGEDGSPTNIGSLVEALVESKPHLAAGGQRRVVDLNQGAQGGAGRSLDDAALMGLNDADFLKALGQ
jgi:hypothetical protein